MQGVKGFTLVELLTTLAVSAIAVTVAVPAMSSFTANSKQSGAINEFVYSLHLARTAAITDNTRVTICASDSGTDCESVSWDRGWIVFADPDSDRSVGAGETVIGAAAAVEGLAITTSDFGRSFMFRPNGRAMTFDAGGTSGAFTVCDRRGDEHAKAIIIDRAGRPRSSKTLAGGGAPTCG